MLLNFLSKIVTVYCKGHRARWSSMNTLWTLRQYYSSKKVIWSNLMIITTELSTPHINVLPNWTNQSISIIKKICRHTFPLYITSYIPVMIICRKKITLLIDYNFFVVDLNWNLYMAKPHVISIWRWVQ